MQSQLNPGWTLGEALSSQGFHSLVRVACREHDCRYIAKIMDPNQEFRYPGYYLEREPVRTELTISKHMSDIGVGPIIYDMALNQNEGIMIMGRYDGTLAELLYLYQRDRSIPMADILRLVGQLLDKIHQAGVIHGDLLPSNILYTKNGVFAITDYGMALYSNDPELVQNDKDFLNGIVEVYESINQGRVYDTVQDIIDYSLP